MGPPQLDHDLSHSTLEVLSRGLQGASSRARAWIFTGGASHGAAELVHLYGQDEHHLGLDHEGIELEPNHSHFIFADDGSGDLADRHELKLRNKLERYICEGSAYQSHGRTPRVLLVVNGHEHTLRVVLESLSRPQPVLVLADTGGAAGDIANYVASGVLPKTGPTTKYPRLARAMLPEIARMGRACGGNGQPLLVLVEAGELALQSDAGGLEMTILSSLLNDVQTEGDKVKLTVMWGEQTLLRNQLLQQQEHNQEANCHALEAALLRRAHLSVHRKGKAQSLGHQRPSQHATPVVTTLIGFVPDPRFVRMDHLFAAPLNRYRVLEHLWEGAQTDKRRIRRRSASGEQGSTQHESPASRRRQLSTRSPSSEGLVVEPTQSRCTFSDDTTAAVTTTTAAPQDNASNSLRLDDATPGTPGAAGTDEKKGNGQLSPRTDEKKDDIQLLPPTDTEKDVAQLSRDEAAAKIQRIRAQKIESARRREEQASARAERSRQRAEKIAEKSADAARRTARVVQQGIGKVMSIAEQTAGRGGLLSHQNWREILSSLVGGYKRHLDIRAGVIPYLPPNWTDLTMWATLVGSERLIEALWAQTHEPLRAAIMGAQVCRSLGRMNHLRAEQDDLEERAKAYEERALGLLDAIPDSSDALPLLTMVPTLRADPRFERVRFVSQENLDLQQLLWTDSPIDLASRPHGTLTAPCMKLIVHRHCKYLFDSYMAGDYPGSKARIPLDTHPVRILLQIIFFFLPGVFCEVMPSHYANEQTGGQSGGEEHHRHGSHPGQGQPQRLGGGIFGHAASVHPQPVTNGGGQNASSENLGSAAEASVGKPDVVEDVETEWDDEFADETMTQAVEDFVADVVSLRGIYFFAVPEVKLYFHWLSHVAYTVLLFIVSVYGMRDQTGQLTGVINGWEYALWGFTIARCCGLLGGLALLILEKKKLDVENKRSNGLSLINVVIIMALRVYVQLKQFGADSFTRAPSGLAAGGTVAMGVYLHAASGHDDSGEVNADSHDWVQLLFAVQWLYGMLNVLEWTRMSEFFAQVSESHGVLFIIFKEMLVKDVTVFMLLYATIYFGFAAWLACIVSNYPTGNPFAPPFHSMPLFQPLWGLVGDMELAGLEDLVLTNHFLRHTVPLMIWLYLFVATVVLVNLLIAAMSTTYAEVQDESYRYWQYSRVSLILDYKDGRTALPPPLNVLVDVPRALWWLLCKLREVVLRVPHAKPDEASDTHGFRAAPNASMLRKLRLRELEGRDRFLRRRDQEQRDSDHLGAYMTLLEARLETMERSARARQEQLLQGQKVSKLQEQMMGLARGRSGASV